MYFRSRSNGIKTFPSALGPKTAQVSRKSERITESLGKDSFKVTDFGELI